MIKTIIAGGLRAGLATAFATAVTLSFSTAAMAESEYRICAEKGNRGWILTDGPGAVFTDWQANKIIGEIIGDGRCQSGWTLQTKFDHRLSNHVEHNKSNFAMGGNSESSTVTTDAKSRTNLRFNRGLNKFGAVPESYVNGNGVTFNFGSHDPGAGTVTYIRSTDSKSFTNTYAFFNDKDPRSKSNDCGVGKTYNKCMQNYSYNRKRDTVTTNTDASSAGYTVTRKRTFCPSSAEWTIVGPNGNAVVKTAGRVFPCKTKTVSSVITTTRSNPASTSVNSNRYVTNPD